MGLDFLEDALRLDTGVLDGLDGGLDLPMGGRRACVAPRVRRMERGRSGRVRTGGNEESESSRGRERERREKKTRKRREGEARQRWTDRKVKR